MTLASPEENKEIYRTLHDHIAQKRTSSPSPIRRHAHTTQHNAFLEIVPPGSAVLDAGCGEGALSILLAKHGCTVTGVDISEPNIAACMEYAKKEGVADRITFLVGDVENLPLPDKSFPFVVSSHVLEHVPTFAKGASELSRVCSGTVIVAIPTCLNPTALVLLGRDKYWTFSRRTPYAIFKGFLRVVVALLTNQEGVNEGYAGRMDLIHIWRFPWKGKKALQAGGLQVVKFRGSSYIFPYFSFLLPFTKFIEKFAWIPVVRNFGYGTTYVCVPSSAIEVSSMK